jgi:uncharacterized protein (TIGR02231 family)
MSSKQKASKPRGWQQPHVANRNVPVPVIADEESSCSDSEELPADVIDTEVKKQAITTDSQIVRAVVYAADRAQVFRSCELTLEPGEHTVHVEGLWTEADRDSLQVNVKRGGAAAVLRAVQFTTVTTVEDVRPQAAALGQQLKEKRAEQKTLQEDGTLLESAIATYMAVRAKLVKRSVTVGEGKPAPTAYDPAKWSAMTTFIAKGLAEHKSKRAQLVRKLADVATKIRELEQKLAQYGGQHVRRTTRDVAELLLTITAEEGSGAGVVKLALELSYLVRGANWTPVYDVRIDSVNRRMQLAYNANIRNMTGEDWKNIKIELSTAPATRGGTMPALRQWRLQDLSNVQQTNYGYGGLYQQQQQQQESLSRPPQMMQQMHCSAPASANMFFANAPSAPPPPLPRPRDFSAATSQAATVSSQGGSSTFRVAAAASVKSDNQPVKVAVGVLDLPVHFRYSAVPKIDPNVYLKVRAENTTDFDILPGKANVFSDNQLVSTTTLDAVAPGEDFWTFLGTDDDISVRRVKQPHHTVSTSGGFLSAKRKVRAFTFHYTVKNMKGREEEIVIWDQYPIPTDKKINVEAKVPTAEGDVTPCELRPIGATGKPTAAVPGRLLHKINDDRFIEWFVPLAPGHEAKFDFSFTVDYPEDVAVAL